MPKSIIKNIIADRKQLNEYFAYYEYRFRQCRSMEISDDLDTLICIANRLIRLHFSSRLLYEAFIPSLKLAREKAEGMKPTEEITDFYIWQDDISAYYPKDGNKRDIWMLNNEHARISIPPGEEYLTAYDFDNQNAYYCLRPNDFISLRYSAHPFKSFFHQWALQNGLLFVHCAAIRINDTGILISGLGGRGKSTTAVNALVNGHYYVGDDYVMLDAEEARCCYQTYCTAYLNNDMLKPLGIQRDNIIRVDELRNNKTLVDLSVYQNLFLDAMKYDMILFPNLVNEKVEIIRTMPGRAIAQMVFSSANQNVERTNIDFMKKIMSCMKGIPVYQFNIGLDVVANIKCLEKFIMEGNIHKTVHQV